MINCLQGPEEDKHSLYLSILSKFTRNPAISKFTTQSSDSKLLHSFNCFLACIVDFRFQYFPLGVHANNTNTKDAGIIYLYNTWFANECVEEFH